MDASRAPSRHQQPAVENSGGANKMAELDAPLHAIGFEIEELYPARLTGRLLVTPTCCQVWEVQLWKMNPSTGGKGPQIAEARITLLSNLPLTEEFKNAGDAPRKYSKL